MSTYSDIIAAIKARVDTVSNVGSTHAYNRWNADWSTYHNQFKVTIGGVSQIRGWVVTMDESNPIAGEPYSLGSTKRTYNVLIYGILDLKDTSNTEDTFLSLVESVMNALDGRTDLGLSVVIDFDVGPCSLRRYDSRQFGSVLCHYCEIIIPVGVEVAVTYA